MVDILQSHTGTYCQQCLNERPTAAPLTFPYLSHRTMAEVLRDERQPFDYGSPFAVRAA